MFENIDITTKEMNYRKKKLILTSRVKLYKRFCQNDVIKSAIIFISF